MRWVWAAAVFLGTGLVALVAEVLRHQPHQGLTQMTTLNTVEAKLRLLRECGIQIGEAGATAAHRPNAREPEFWDEWTRVIFRLAESGDATTLLCYMDLERIENDGDYAEMAREMARIAGLPLEPIRDRVDLESGQASLTFKIDGAETTWEFEQKDDWVDDSFFRNFQALLRQHAPGRTFIAVGFGQSLGLACVDSEQMARLKAAGTGFDLP